MKDEGILLVAVLFLAFGIGALVGGLMLEAKGRRKAVAHGCASWVADEGGKAVFTWNDE